MKIIFLDFDGVLNNNSCLSCENDLERFDSSNIEILNTICSKTEAFIVISSSYRLFFSLSDLKNALEDKGFNYSGRIIDMTPEIIRNHKHAERGDEIKKWLLDHPEVNKFVILDDNSDMCSLFPYLVKTDPLYGLKKEHEILALNVLNKED